MSRAARLLLLCTAIGWSSPASADAGEWAFGPQITAQAPVAGRIGTAGRVGITDWVAAEARLGVGYDRESVSTHGALGVVFAWDVLAWVPELCIAGGAQLDRDGVDPRVAADLGLRHHFGPRSSLGVAAGAEWGPAGKWAASLRATLWLAIF